MAEIYTKEEIILKIKAIDKQIEKSMGMASYNFEDGQGKQSVTSQSLKDLLALKKSWEIKLQNMNMPNSVRWGVDFNKW